jgi:hypothetical protein
MISLRRIGESREDGSRAEGIRLRLGTKYNGEGIED